MKNPFSRITLGIAMLTAAMLSCTSVHADVLKAGTAKVNITLPDSRYPVCMTLSMPTAWYLRREKYVLPSSHLTWASISARACAGNSCSNMGSMNST